MWASTLDYIKLNVEELARVQRRAVIRSICAYRTISRVAGNILASVPPIDLMAAERLATFVSRRECNQSLGRGERMTQHRDMTLQQWQERLEDGNTGRWTVSLVGDVAKWSRRNHGQVNFHLTQLLSGHGCFGSYLEKIKKEVPPGCHHCPAQVDDARHTLIECSAWNIERVLLEHQIGKLDERMLVNKMLSSQAAWEAVQKFAEVVMRRKEEAERDRQINNQFIFNVSRRHL